MLPSLKVVSMRFNIFWQVICEHEVTLVRFCRSLSYRQIDAATLKQTQLADVVQALRQHPHRQT
jgi:hypothetical protein